MPGGWVTFKFSLITLEQREWRTSATKEVGRAWADRPCRYTLITLVTLCDVSPLFRESPPWDSWVNDAGVNVGIKPPQTRSACVRAVLDRRIDRGIATTAPTLSSSPSPPLRFLLSHGVNLIRSGATLIPRRVHRPRACLVRSTGRSSGVKGARGRSETRE